MTGFVIEDEPLDEETKERVSKALEDLKEGRSLSKKELMEMLESP